MRTVLKYATAFLLGVAVGIAALVLYVMNSAIWVS